MNLSARNALTAALAVALGACGERGGGGTGGGSGQGGGNCAPFCASGGGSGTGGATGTGGGSGTGGATGTGGGSGTGGATGTGGGSGTGGATGAGGGSGTGGSGTGGSGTGGSGTGGSGTGGGSSFDAGQAANAKGAAFCSPMVQLRGVVVSVVENQFVGTSGEVRSNFWLIDPGNPRTGLYAFKDYTDTIDGMTTVGLTPGDVINIDASLSSTFANSFINNGGEAYRYSLQKGCGGANGTPMQIVIVSHGAAPADNTAPAGFGFNPDGGRVKGLSIGNQRFVPYAGARVQIPGPLSLSNPIPVEMKRSTVDPADQLYFGFEVTGTFAPGGILVRDNRTFGNHADGGPRGCDYRRIVFDGGTVDFPNGIKGVWDTYSHAACLDGGGGCANSNGTRDAGQVPGLGVPYTFVLEPIDCSDLSPANVTP